MEEEEYIQENPMLQTSQGKFTKLESDAFGFIQSFVLMLLPVVILFTFVSPITKVSGRSMEPTLHDSDILLMRSLGYTPKADDVVIINNPTIAYLDGQSFVKRVIAVGGQSVVIHYEENQVLVDGVALQEDYIAEHMRPIYGETDLEPIVVPEGYVFVLGDNRNNSADSRSSEIGLVDTRYIIGKVVCGIWPMSAWQFF